MNSHENIRSKFVLFAIGSAVVLAFALSIISCSKRTVGTVPITRNVKPIEVAIDINTATSDELERLPGIGPKTAKEIIEFRTKYGKFQKTEHLMLLRGISDKRFRKFRRMVKTR